MKQSSSLSFSTTVDLSCEPHALVAVLQLLSHGVLVRSRVPATIRGLLCGQWGISDEYLDKRINTLFLNGKAVDDVDNAMVRNGATLALSASMPGFVGAAFRRGGYYAAMRDNVSYVEEGDTGEVKEGLVTLKLFNMTCPELGPLLLASGVCMEGKALGIFLAERPERFWNGCRSPRVNGREVDLEELRHRDWSQELGLVVLKATSTAADARQPA